MNKLNAMEIFNGSEAKVLKIATDEQVKFQAVGEGTYTIKGKLQPDCEWDDICAIKAADYSTNSMIDDNGVWIADASGYYEITVEASGFDKIYAVTVG